MSGYQSKGPKIPDPGSGMLRPPKDPKEKSPAFTGLVNYNGQIISMSIWYMAPSGQMPASFSVKVQPYDPNRGQQPQQGGYPPQQQGFNYGQQPPQQGYAPQQGYPQQGQAPQHHAPPPPQHAPQHTQQYQPAQQHAPPPPQYPPQGYQPAPQAGPPPQYPPRQQAANYGDPGATFQREEIPF